MNQGMKEQALLCLSKTSSPDLMWMVLNRAAGVNDSAWICKVIREALSLKSYPEVVLLICILADKIKDSEDFAPLAAELKNHPEISTPLLLRGCLIKFAEDRKFFPAFKRALQDHFFVSLDCPTLSHYLGIAEGKNASSSVLKPLLERAKLSKDSYLSERLIDILIRHRYPGLEGDYLIRFISEVFESLTCDYIELFDSVVSYYEKSAASEQAEMRKALTESFFCVRTMQVKFESWMGSLSIKLIAKAKMKGVDESYVKLAYKNIISHRRNQNLGLATSPFLFLLFVTVLQKQTGLCLTKDIVEAVDFFLLPVWVPIRPLSAKMSPSWFIF